MSVTFTMRAKREHKDTIHEQVITDRNEVLAKVMFLHLCHSVHGGEGVPDQAPPHPDQAGTPPDQGGTPPEPGRYPQTRHPRTREDPPWDQAGPPRDQTPPRPGRNPPRPDTPTLPGPGRTPQDQTPPRDQGGTPLDQTPPGTREEPPPPRNSRLRNTVNVRPVRILLECILVFIILSKMSIWINTKTSHTAVNKRR